MNNTNHLIAYETYNTAQWCHYCSQRITIKSLNKVILLKIKTPSRGQHMHQLKDSSHSILSQFIYYMERSAIIEIYMTTLNWIRISKHIQSSTKATQNLYVDQFILIDEEKQPIIKSKLTSNIYIRNTPGNPLTILTMTMHIWYILSHCNIVKFQCAIYIYAIRSTIKQTYI